MPSGSCSSGWGCCWSRGMLPSSVRSSSTISSPPSSTDSIMEGGGSKLETARRRTTLTRSQGGTWGSMRSPRSLGGSGQTHHSEINCASGWEGRRQRTTTRRTGPEGREGGTWGQTSTLDSESVCLQVQEELSASEAKVHLPPGLSPTILPFWNTTPGASSSTSSSPSPGTSSSSKRKRRLETTS
jgi:hypothetical protein